MDSFIKLDAAENTFRVVGGSETHAALANRFLRTIEIRGLAKHSIRSYGYDLVVFFRWMEQRGKSLKTFTETDLMEFIGLHRERKAAAKTINRRLNTCRLVYEFAFDKPIPTGKHVNRPARHFIGKLYEPNLGIIRFRRGGRLKIRVKEPRRLIEPLTAEQVNAFFRRITRYRDIVIVCLMLLCGLRSNEVISLRLADISFGERQLPVRGKGSKERIVPLPELLLQAIGKYLKIERPKLSSSSQLLLVLQGPRRGEPMTLSGLRSIFRQRRKHPALRSAHAHRMRHTFGADMARAGVTLPTLQRMMGHSTPVMTRHYIDLSVEDIKDEYERAIEKLKGRYAPSLQG